MPYSESRKRATLKYRAKALDRIQIEIPKGEKEIWKKQAAKRGLSLNAYLIDLVKRDMES